MAPDEVAAAHDQVMSIDQTTFTRDRQSYQLVRIQTVNEPVSVLRATVKVDAYPQQSFARVERFDGERWHEVLTHPGAAFFAQMPSYASQLDSQCEAAAARVAQPLIELAAQILAEASGA